MKATINLTHVLAALQSASSEETRYYLCGVQLEIFPRHVFAVATDGHTLISAFYAIDKDAENNTLLGSFILWAADLRKIKASKAGPVAELTRVDATTLKINSDFVRLVDGTFPDWRRIFPLDGDVRASDAAEYIDTMDYDPRKLMKFVKAGEILAGTRRKAGLGYGYSLTRGDSGPAIVRFADDHDVIGLVMPCRANNERSTLPAWLKYGYSSAPVAQAAEYAPWLT